MARRSCDGAGLLAAFRAAVANLETHVDEVNGLNVFPVPDGDTGSNMLATVAAALEEAERISGQPVDRVAGAISFGALMGARGNSGVIASQIFRGMADGLEGKRRFNGLDLAHALDRGTKAAYAAVARPVEGTILTVVREAAAVAVETAERTNDLEAVLGSTVDAAERSVAKTPSLLPILREAGVVDAGGQGLYRLFQGALLHLLGQVGAGAVSTRRLEAAKPSALVAHADEGFGYETMFLLWPGAGHSLDVDAIRMHLESIGESVLVAGDPRAVKVHVHNERPDAVITYGLTLGTLTRISVTNLDDQARDVRDERAMAFAGPGPGHPPVEPGPDARSLVAGPPSVEPAGPPLPLAVIAVTAGDGLAAVFESFGVARVVRGGQSANPSIGELLTAVESVNAREVLILPNNPNVVLAARQVAAMTERPVSVVATRNAAEGFAALLVLDPTAGAAANAASMTEAGRAIQTLSVTEAVRDARIGGRKVKKGQTIVLDPDDGLVAADSDPQKAVLAAIAALQPGFELVTLYYGDGADLSEAEALARLIGGAASGVEVEVIHGGQPFYQFLIAAE